VTSSISRRCRAIPLATVEHDYRDAGLESCGLLPHQPWPPDAPAAAPAAEPGVRRGSGPGQLIFRVVRYGFEKTNFIMIMRNLTFALVVLILDVTFAQRAKWKFEIAPFDSYFVCSTQSSIEQSMALCQAQCRAGMGIPGIKNMFRAEVIIFLQEYVPTKVQCEH
jgi:hypothetical protein